MHKIVSIFKPKQQLERDIYLPHSSTSRSQLVTKDKYLILGFFNRGNLGDQAFIKPYQLLFPDVGLIFLSIDDAHEVPKGVSTIILAGGDIINDYFMKKVRALLQKFTGPCYAFSVGVPYDAEAKYATMFDHVITRSLYDNKLLSKTCGDRNVEYLPDITWLYRDLLPKMQITPTPPGKKRFAFALAQPAFYDNPNSPKLIDAIVNTIYGLIAKYPTCEVNLLAFNTSVFESESDYVINEKVMARLAKYPNVINRVDTSFADPLTMLKFMSSLDLCVCMRFHSVIFSQISGIPFVATYVTKKIGRMLEDEALSEWGYDLPHDAIFKPTNIDDKTLLALINTRLTTRFERIHKDTQIYYRLKDIVALKKRKQMLAKELTNASLDITLDKCRQFVMGYLYIDEQTYDDWLFSVGKTMEILEAKQHAARNFARVLCFAITNKIGGPYIWGLSENIVKPDFIPYEAIKWIHEDNAVKAAQYLTTHSYYPWMNPQKSLVIDLNYMCQDNYAGLHRSGWSYVISGLQHLDTMNVEKPPNVLVDTCLERTFLWGLDVTRTANIVPYKKPWVGFVHHTFNTTYSKYNCTTLLDTPEFIASLPACKALFTLSEHLKTVLIAELAARNLMTPVISVSHPTEFVEQTFDLAKFMDAPKRRVVHVGAWLRDPYAIYALPIPANNKLGITKVALKGKEMDNYFKPNWLMDKIFDMLKDYHEVTPSTGGGLCRPEDASPPGSPQSSSTPVIFTNKFLEGMIKQFNYESSSVEVVNFADNADYDNMLSESIVFLSLIDASASNTVVECIVRNTPLIVNRLPALEEVLGVDYPGFYTTGNLLEAASIIMDVNNIFFTHMYMKKLNKDKYRLENFLQDFQQKLAAVL